MSRSIKQAISVFLIILALPAITGLIAGCGDEEASRDTAPAETPRDLDPTTIGEYNKPGIVLVETTWTADVTVPDIEFDEDALFAYFDSLAAGGQLPADITEQELLDLMVEELVLNPEYYVYATATDRATSMDSSVYGSGFIVTEDGYLLTNAHVIKKSEEDLQLQMALQAGGDFLYEDLARFEEYIGIDLDPEYEDIFLGAVASLYDQYMTVTSPETEVMMYTVNVDGKLSDPFPAETVEVGDPIDLMEDTGKDVAVLKVDEKNLPTVAIGDDSDLRDGEQAIAVGYPSVATFDPNFDLTNIAPTLTQGIISSQKKMEGGWEVIQTDATISGGSSGSPLFNSRGEAIAINTFGATELNEQTGEIEVQPGYNYAVPATVVREFLDDADVEPALGPLTIKYHEAVDLYDEEHYSAARLLFEEIDDANTDYPYVDEYIESSADKIDDGKDKPVADEADEGSSIPLWLFGLIGGALGIGIGSFLALRSRRKKMAAGTGVKAAAPAVPAAAVEETPAPASEAGATPADPEATPESAPSESREAEASSKETTNADGHSLCSKCGHELGPEDEFCSKCGEHVT
ncbi:MAG: trypsin-like peptidase domain-containing protein [Thermoleophilia bacterium]